MNIPLWHQIQSVLGEFLANHHTDGAYVWSKTEGMVKVGATYNAYEFSGNLLVVKVDRALTLEYPDKGYGVMIDLTADKTANRPALEAFTVEGRELIENTVTGAAIRNGEVSTPVAGIKYIMSGYCGIACYNPYRSVILMEN